MVACNILFPKKSPLYNDINVTDVKCCPPLSCIGGLLAQPASHNTGMSQHQDRTVVLRMNWEAFQITQLLFRKIFFRTFLSFFLCLIVFFLPKQKEKDSDETSIHTRYNQMCFLTSKEKMYV